LAGYCKRHDFLLAPHGKTTMAPQLLKLQLDDGAWAVTRGHDEARSASGAPSAWNA